MIVEELKRIESMVGDLLLVGRLDDDRAALQRERIDAEDFLHIVADRWSVVGERAWTIDIDAPGTFVADGNTLAQAIDNVIENAVSYTSAGDAIIRSARAASARSLEIEVARHRARHPGSPRSPTSSTASTAPTGRAPARRAARASGSRSCATSSRRTAARWRSSRPGRAARA